MHGWSYSCILAALICGVANMILPEKFSPNMAKGVKFLTSLVLVIVVFSPVLKFLSGGGSAFDALSFAKAGEFAEPNNGEWILNTMAARTKESMEKAVREEFPGVKFSLELVMGESFEVETVKISGCTPQDGEKIKVFLEKKYEMEPK